MPDELIRILQDGNHSLVVAGDGIRTFDGRGISDLYGLLTEHPGWLRGASVADKVVGKGAAALLILAVSGNFSPVSSVRPPSGC